MERVLQPETIVGTPEAESYFRDQSRRMFKHALRGDLDIDVDDLDTLAPGPGLYVIEGDDEGDDTEVVVVEGGRGVPMPGAGLYVRPDGEEGTQKDQTTEEPLPVASLPNSPEQNVSVSVISPPAGEIQQKTLVEEVIGVCGTPEAGNDDAAAPGRSSSFERLYDGVELAAVPGASAVSAEQLEGRVGDKFETRTLPPASSFEDVYRRALNDDDVNSEDSDESDATYPSVIAAGPAVLARAGDIADEVVKHAVSDAAVVSEQPAKLDMDSDDEFEFLERQLEGEEDPALTDDVEDLVSGSAGDKVLTGQDTKLEEVSKPDIDDTGNEFEVLERQLLSEGADADDEFERLERQLAAEEETVLCPPAAVGQASSTQVAVEDAKDIHDVPDKVPDPRSDAHEALSSPVVECLSDDIQESSAPKQASPSPEPVVSTPTRPRRGAPVHRHETFHHVPRVTVTDTDGVHDVTDDGAEGLVTEPDDEDSDSDAGGRPTIVELADDDDVPGNPSVVHLML